MAALGPRSDWIDPSVSKVKCSSSPGASYPEPPTIRSVVSSTISSSGIGSAGSATVGAMRNNRPPSRATSFTDHNEAKRPVHCSAPSAVGTAPSQARSISLTTPPSSPSAGPSMALVSTDTANPASGSNADAVAWPG